MSRSPYDPAPSYAYCRYCGSQYDNSGYYGTDDESHLCEAKARVWLRMLIQRGLDAERLAADVRSDLAKEEAERKEKERRTEMALLESRLNEARERVSRLEEDLRLLSDPAVARPD